MCVCVTAANGEQDLLGHSTAGGVESACWGRSAGVGCRPPSGCTDRETRQPLTTSDSISALQIGFGLPTLAVSACHVFLIKWRLFGRGKASIRLDVSPVRWFGISVYQHNLNLSGSYSWIQVGSVTAVCRQQMAESTHVCAHILVCSRCRCWQGGWFVIEMDRNKWGTCLDVLLHIWQLCVLFLSMCFCYFALTVVLSDKIHPDSYSFILVVYLFSCFIVF